MYEAYFGLDKLPFCVTPDSRSYVETAPHRAAIQALKDGLQRGAEFVWLAGESGAGKTTVALQLLHEMDPARHLVAALPRLGIEGDRLFDRVAEVLGTPRGGGLPPLGSVMHQLEELVRGGRDALLLVDDAHEFDAGTLRRLRKLAAVRVDGKAALRVCLVGQAMPPVVQALQIGGRRADLGETVRLQPLGAADTHEYILARLGRAGWRGWPTFGAATIAIHERCQGNPMRTDRLCDQILLRLYQQGRDDVTPGVVRAVDDLMQAEQRGEPASLVLPPPGPVGLRAVRETSFALDTDIRISSDALMRRLLAKPPLALDLPDRGSAPPDDPPGPVPASGATQARRRGVAQGAVALALVAAAGLLWEVFPSLSANGAAPLLAVNGRGTTEIEPPATEATVAAGMATLAEQTIARSPTGAGPALPVFRPASGPRSSPPAR